MKLLPIEELKSIPEFLSSDILPSKSESVIRLRVDCLDDPDFWMRLAQMPNLQSLSVSRCDIGPALRFLTGTTILQSFSFQGFTLNRIPKEILCLPHLKELTITGTNLCELPEEIGDLVYLEELDLSHNGLESLPDCIGKLSLLKRLDLRGNRLRSVPDSIGELKQLTGLLLRANQLADIPASLGRLLSLEYLLLGCNHLRRLPEELCSLKHLRSLCLERNPWETLPAGLSQMRIENFNLEPEKRHLFMDWDYQHGGQSPKLELDELGLFLAADSLACQTLSAAIERKGLGEFGPAILRLSRRAIKMETTSPDDYSQLARSRFGGFPDLPDASHFPKTNGLHWCFLCQINLADVALLNAFLPRTGLLSIFTETALSFRAKILLIDIESQALLTVRHQGESDMVDPADAWYSLHPHQLRFTEFQSLPIDPPEGMQGESEQEAYREIQQSCYAVDHHVNGWSYVDLSSPQTEAAMVLRGQPEEWVPLLTLGFDSKAGFCFGDAGKLIFCIHQEDLRRWDFSRIHITYS